MSLEAHIARSRAHGGLVRTGAVGATTIANFTYPSTLDSLPALAGRYAYTAGWAGRPILLLQHGLNNGAANIGDATYTRLARLGFFVLGLSLRGMGGSSGTADLGAREIHDVIDGVSYVRNHATLGALVHPTRCSIAGYSNGGACALSTLTKVPDLCSVYVAHFPPTDYAEFYADSPAPTQALIESWVGGSPATVPNNYAARSVRESVAGALGLVHTTARPGPRLFIFHDQGDSTVDVTHTTLLTALLDAAGLQARYQVDISDSGDPTPQRYLHGYPETVPGLSFAEPTWTTKALNGEPWTLPTRGTILVKGWFRSVSRGFAVWLGDSTGSNPKTDADGGKEHEATIVYDLAARTFTVTPLTGATKVRCEIGALAQTQDVSTAETVITVPS